MNIHTPTVVRKATLNKEQLGILGNSNHIPIIIGVVAPPIWGYNNTSKPDKREITNIGDTQ